MCKTDLGAWGGDNAPKSADFMDFLAKFQRHFGNCTSTQRAKREKGVKGYTRAETFQSLSKCVQKTQNNHKKSPRYRPRPYRGRTGTVPNPPFSASGRVFSGPWKNLGGGAQWLILAIDPPLLHSVHILGPKSAKRQT